MLGLAKARTRAAFGYHCHQLAAEAATSMCGEVAMKILYLVIFLLVPAFATVALAKTPHTNVVPIRDAGRLPPPVDTGRRVINLRQDLFDRNSPNKLQSDCPGPSAQPGQF